MHTLSSRLLPILVVLTLILGTVPPPRMAPTPVAAQVAPTAEYAPDTVLVKVRADAVAPDDAVGALSAVSSGLAARLQEMGVGGGKRLFRPRQQTRAAFTAAGLDRVYRLSLAPDTDVLAVVATLKQDPGIEYAEPNYLVYRTQETPTATPTLSIPPNDPYYF